MSKRILIVDDAAFMRMMLRNMLEKAEYTIVGEASNGRMAIEAYQEHTPDLVLMDITMPEMDGIEALKGIKVLDPKAKIIMCSAMGQQTMVMDAIKYGASDFVVKPFNNTRVLEALKRVLG